MHTPFTLYHRADCPFCLLVRDAADDLGLALHLVDVAEHPEARTKLLAERGRATVPVLGFPQVDGSERLLGESADIITFLDRWAARVAA
jgi:glutaredoxin